MVPGAFYKWQVQCGCIIDLSIPIPARFQASNIHISPWSGFDLFTNLNLAPIYVDNQSDIFDQLSQGSLKAFPNPFNDELNLEFESEDEREALIEIYNSLGQVVFGRSLNLRSGENLFTFNTQDFETGIFFVNIVTQEKIISYKVAKF